jgi:site-specific DNA-adenine methylase
MAYLGGKSKGYEHIIKYLNKERFNGMKYIEPFCGYCHILRRVENKKKYYAYDKNPLLIELLSIFKARRSFIISQKNDITH